VGRCSTSVWVELWSGSHIIAYKIEPDAEVREVTDNWGDGAKISMQIWSKSGQKVRVIVRGAGKRGRNPRFYGSNRRVWRKNKISKIVEASFIIGGLWTVEQRWILIASRFPQDLWPKRFQAFWRPETTYCNCTGLNQRPKDPDFRWSNLSPGWTFTRSCIISFR